jgi:hypothetical protein
MTPVNLPNISTSCLSGYVKTYIILPGTIYGIATGPLVDLALQNPHSQQVPSLIKLGIDRGQGGVVGLGKNIWPHVHISDSRSSRPLLSLLSPSQQFLISSFSSFILFFKINY